MMLEVYGTDILSIFPYLSKFNVPTKMKIMFGKI